MELAGTTNNSKPKSMFFIHAANVHEGGGRILLESLLKVIDIEFFLLIDERMPLPTDMPTRIHVKVVKPSVLNRLAAEWWLFRNVTPDDIILCFGNLPPLFKSRGQTVVFVQNRYLVEDVRLNGFPIKVRLRLEIERLWISAKLRNVAEYVVQTPTMKRLLEIKTEGHVPVRVLPFVAEPIGYMRIQAQLKTKNEAVFDFVYVASGEPHKNHRQLIEAWCLLGEDGYYPTLKLTIDQYRFSELNTWITDKINQHRLNVENLGNLSYNGVGLVFTKARALIYPSLFESFGLPLIEARQAGLPVLASELDYVRDVLDPEQTFNPDSALSIAKAVKRFMGWEEAALPLQGADGFLQEILGRKL